MNKIIILTLVISLFACGKYTTQKKVDRKIIKGSWNMFEFVDNGISINKKYLDVTLTFGEGGTIGTTTEGNVSGTWESGTQKNPAVVYINFPTVADSMHILSDDWVVYKLTNKECILKRNEGLEFDYDNSFDGLTLRKKE